MQSSPPSPSPEGSGRRASNAVMGRKQVSDFLIGRVLGSGAYARVFICRLKSTASPSKSSAGIVSKDLAMKVMEKRFIVKLGKTKEVQMERRVLSEVAHPNVVRLLYSFHDPDRLFLVMDLCPGGELARLIRYMRSDTNKRALTETQTKFYLSECVSAVAHLHSLGFIHRDLKPENVLIATNGHVKISDFGTAKDKNAPVELKSGELKRRDTFCGTAEYVSPEALQGEPSDFALDYWALGVMMWCMLTGRTPFIAESEYLTFQRILAYARVPEAMETLRETMPEAEEMTCETLSFPSGTPDLSSESLSLVKALLHPKPELRLSDPAKTKDHPFFEGIDFARLGERPAPELPYEMDLDPPTLDGAENDWLLSDDGGIDLMDEISEANNNGNGSSKRISASTGGLASPSKHASTRRTASGGLPPRRGSSSSEALNTVASYTSHMHTGERVVLEGPVLMSANFGLVTRRRHLIFFTDDDAGTSRMIFVEPSTAQLKGELPLGRDAVIHVKGSGRDFEVVSGKGTFRFRDVMGATAVRWRNALLEVQGKKV